MRYLVDTNICIGWLKGDGRIRKSWVGVAGEEVLLSSIVRAELLFGARHSQHVSANLARLEALFAALTPLPFNDRAAEQYGLIREQLTAGGRLIGPNDLLIAASALAEDAVLVTRNAKEFSRVAGLRVEAW